MAHHKHHHHRRGGAFAQAAKLEERKVDARKATPQTIVSVIYTTAAPTFDGPVAGYTTLGPAVGPPVQVQQQPQQFAPSPTAQVAQSVASPNVLGGGLLAHSPQQTTAQRTGGSAAATTIGDPSTQTSSPSDPSSQDSNAAQATPEAFNPPTTTSDPATAASATAGPGTASATAKSSSGGGTSGGAKAGIAFAVLLGLGALAALLFFLWRKKKAAKNAAYGKTLDEKHNDNMVPGNYPHPDNGMAYGAGAARSMSTRTADAPRLSLRPLTQFDPHLAGQRKSSGNPMAMALAPSGGAASLDQQRSVTSPATQRKPLNPTGPSRVNDPANPFGSHAEPSDHLAPGVIPAAAAAAGGAAPRPITRFPSAAGNAEREAAMATNGDRGLPVAQTNEPFAAAAAPLPTGNSPPQQLRAPSPTASEYSSFSSVPGSPSKTGAAVAGGALAAGAAGAAAAAGGKGASPVHRVQLDFKPSMDDELGLQAGQLVRLLHEYDDGWALCIRMDRSQQGVCPRTCLSTRPVKPRPAQGGPRGPPPPGMRGPPHMQQPGRPMSPANGGRQSPGPRMQPGYPPNGSPYGGPPGRPMSPSYGFPPAPRPLSPGGRRAPSPGPRQGGRARNSSDPFARGGGRPMSPSGHRNGGGRPRSNSGSQLVAQGGGRMPPGPSRMNPNASPPLGSQPRQPYNPQDVPMVLRSVGSGQPQYNAGPGSSPPSQNPLKAVARKPAPGQAM